MFAPQVRDHKPAVRVRARAHRPDLLPHAVRPQRGPVPDELVPLLSLLPFLQQKELLRPLRPTLQPAEPQQQDPGSPRQTEVRVPSCGVLVRVCVQNLVEAVYWRVCGLSVYRVLHLPHHHPPAIMAEIVT